MKTSTFIIIFIIILNLLFLSWLMNNALECVSNPLVYGANDLLRNTDGITVLGRITVFGDNFRTLELFFDNKKIEIGHNALSQKTIASGLGLVNLSNISSTSN